MTPEWGVGGRWRSARELSDGDDLPVEVTRVLGGASTIPNAVVVETEAAT
jgi:hypothetical protein